MSRSSWQAVKLLPCVAEGQPVVLYNAGRLVVRWIDPTSSWSRCAASIYVALLRAVRC